MLLKYNHQNYFLEQYLNTFDNGSDGGSTSGFLGEGLGGSLGNREDLDSSLGGEIFVGSLGAGGLEGSVGLGFSCLSSTAVDSLPLGRRVPTLSLVTIFEGVAAISDKSFGRLGVFLIPNSVTFSLPVL